MTDRMTTDDTHTARAREEQAEAAYFASWTFASGAAACCWTYWGEEGSGWYVIPLWRNGWAGIPECCPSREAARCLATQRNQEATA